MVCRVFHILVSLRVLRRTPRTVAPEAYWISLRTPVHFFCVSSYLKKSHTKKRGEDRVTY